LERNTAERRATGRKEGKKERKKERRKKSKRKVNLTIFEICTLLGFYAE